MPIVGMECLTLQDLAKRMGPNDQIAKIIEIIEQQNEILKDAMWLEANNIISAWLVVWGDSTAHMLYPKGLPSGLQREDLGKTTIVDEDSNEYIGYKTNYSWNAGMCVRDWRYVARLANIDTDNLNTLIQNGAAAASAQMLVRSMIHAHNLIPNVRLGRAAWYMNRTVKTMLDLMAAEKANVNLTIKTFEGEEVTSFKGIPIRQCDALIDTEDEVA